jgi:hypothetical protein
LNLKPLICILISTVSTWDIGTNYWYEIPQDFEYWICTLTIPTSSTMDTVTRVVGRIKQWHDFLANNSGCVYSPRPHKQRATPSSMPPFLASAINPTVVFHQPGQHLCPRHRPHCHPRHCPPLSVNNSPAVLTRPHQLLPSHPNIGLNLCGSGGGGGGG